MNFHLMCFADLKKYLFNYKFLFPVFKLKKGKLISSLNIIDAYSPKIVKKTIKQ